MELNFFNPWWQKGKILPIEIKFRKHIPSDAIRTIFNFLMKNNLEKSIMITKETEDMIEKDGKKLFLIPYWKYFTILSLIKE